MSGYAVGRKKKKRGEHDVGNNLSVSAIASIPWDSSIAYKE
jgi:hypothetical protein